MATTNKRLSSHVDTVLHYCAMGDLKAAEDLIRDMSFVDYPSRFVAWEALRQAALYAGDTKLARRAGNEADDYARYMRGE